MPSGSAALRLVEPMAADDGTAATVRSLPHPRLLRTDKFYQHYDAGSDSKWQTEVLGRLCTLLQLPQNWDGYGTPSLRRDACMFALEILERVMQPRTPLPQVVPSSVGGIQLEWHERDVDLELHIATPYRCELWFEDHRTGQEPVSLELTNDFSAFQAAIATLTRH